MSKLICPNCGHTEGGTMRELGVLGITIAATAGVGFLVGGPVGAAVGGGFAGKMAQRAVKLTGKAVGKEVCYRCPNCNTVMEEGTFDLDYLTIQYNQRTALAKIQECSDCGRTVTTCMSIKEADLFTYKLQAELSRTGCQVTTDEIRNCGTIGNLINLIINNSNRSNYIKYDQETALAKIQECSDCGRTITRNMSIEEADLFTYKLQAELSRTRCQVTTDEIRNCGTIGSLINLIINRQN